MRFIISATLKNQILMYQNSTSDWIFHTVSSLQDLHTYSMQHCSFTLKKPNCLISIRCYLYAIQVQYSLFRQLCHTFESKKPGPPIITNTVQVKPPPFPKCWVQYTSWWILEVSTFYYLLQGIRLETRPPVIGHWQSQCRSHILSLSVKAKLTRWGFQGKTPIIDTTLCMYT